MDRNFKRSFVGYAPADVVEKINKANLEYEMEFGKNEKVLNSLDKDICSLNTEMQKVSDSIAATKAIEDQIAKTLLDVHMSSSYDVFKVLEKVEQMKKLKAETVLLYEKERTRLDDIVKNLISELQSRVQEYVQKLDIVSNEKAGERDEA